jgi:hypothetical protein
VSGLNLSQVTEYPQGLHDYPQSLQANFGNTSITLPFDTIQSGILAASLNKNNTKTDLYQSNITILHEALIKHDNFFKKSFYHIKAW